MTGTIQLLAHCAITGMTLGLGAVAFRDRSVWILVGGAALWVVFMFHIADAAWIPAFGKGRDWVDRCGIAIRGSGFAAATLALVWLPSGVSVVLSIYAIMAIVVGRAIWELAVTRFKKG